jgi:ATP-binding cassette subfamily B protein
MARMGGPMAAARALRQDDSVLKAKIKPGTFRRILQVAAPFAPELAFFLLVVTLDAGVGVVNPLLFREIINRGIPSGDVSLVVRLASLAGALILLDAALGLGQSWLATRIGSRVVLSLRVQLFDHVQRMPLAFFMRTQTGALVSRLNTDVGGAQSAFTDVLSSVVGNVVSVVLVLAAMFVLSWKITLAALVLAPLFVLPARRMGKKLQVLTRETYELSAAMNNTMIERFNVAGAQLAKLFGRPGEETRAFSGKAQAVADMAVKRSIYARVFFTGLSLMASGATVLAFGWGGVLAIRGELDVGTLVALTAYLARLYGPITGLSNIQVTVMTALVSFDRVFEVLDLPPAITEKPGAVAIPAGPAEVRFADVSFRYPTAAEVSLASLESVALPDTTREKTVLHNVDFTIAPGSLTALVGPSGAGKTTITQLVARLYDVTDGAILINGLDVRDATLASLRARIGVVTQDAHLFHETIRANLAYAKPEASEDELWAALGDAQIRPVVERLPKRLDTLVGERGYRFSGGEKQRLAIARLLLKAPDIVVLDEATAHLDSESEAAIQAAFERALEGRTAIVIAHRLSTIVKADQILVIDDGRIVERGTHAALIGHGGLYADLYRRQFAADEAGSPSEVRT